MKRVYQTFVGLSLLVVACSETGDEVGTETGRGGRAGTAGKAGQGGNAGARAGQGGAFVAAGSGGAQSGGSAGTGGGAAGSGSGAAGSGAGAGAVAGAGGGAGISSGAGGGAVAGASAGGSAGAGAAGAPTTIATLEDFWERRAYFELDTRVLAPSPAPSASNVHYNADNDVEVFEGVTYWFTRAFKDPRKPECPTDHAQTLVRTSNDGGKTWAAPAVVLDNEPVSAADGCSANDGDVFYDADTGTWHFLYQCLANPALDPGWHLCHATRQGKPDGPFVKDPANPVVKGGAVWNLINPAPKFFDEGTPEIVEKKDGYFYVSFHGVEPTKPIIKIVRGVARTKDFHAWEAINAKDIFSWPNAKQWDIDWKNGESFGGGQATIAREGAFYYELIEAADTNGGCQEDQGWAIGLLRAPSLAADWSPAPNAVLWRESHEKLANGKTGACHTGYAKLFHGVNGERRLAQWRGANDRFPMESDPHAGHFFYTLRKGAPAARFPFREGPGHAFALGDVISRGDLQLALEGPSFIPDADGFALRFDGGPARAVAQRSPVYERTGDFRIRLAATFTKLPASKSAFVAGQPGHYWLELYADGNLCLWVASASGSNNACVHIEGELGQAHTYEGELSGNALHLWRDDVLVGQGASPPPLAGAGFVIGSNAVTTEFFGPVSMDLGSLTFWDRAR